MILLRVAQVDDVSLHGKDNQQAVEILKQTGPVVRLKVARHVSHRLNRTQTPSSLSPESSAGLVETSPAVEQATPVAVEPRKGMYMLIPCGTTGNPWKFLVW